MEKELKDEATEVYQPPVLVEAGRYAEMTEGPGTIQVEGSSGFMV